MALRDAAFKNPDGLLYHGGAVAYALLAYTLGLAGLFSEGWATSAAATLLLAHGMTIAAYMLHECAHYSVFVQNEDNARLGRFLTWVCGAAYGTYEDIRYKHFRHHIDVDDVVWFDYDRFYRRHPAVLRVTEVLEWAYIPAQDLLMHFIMVFTSFLIPKRRSQRSRNVRVIAVRGGIYLALLLLSPKAAILYAIATMIMMTILRFMDSLQHDYGYHLTLFSRAPGPRKGDLVFEQEHTFSNPHSLRSEWLNCFTLNFGFHNAHHAQPTTPWWRLPALHRELFGNDPTVTIPFGLQLLVFHQHRVARILGGAAEGGAAEGGAAEGGAAEDDEELFGRGFVAAARDGEIVGGNAASFLTSF
jgi:omega-6 fatty acid desaturase (delta-12 desaturase)